MAATSAVRSLVIRRASRLPTEMWAGYVARTSGIRKWRKSIFAPRTNLGSGSRPTRCSLTKRAIGGRNRPCTYMASKSRKSSASQAMVPKCARQVELDSVHSSEPRLTIPVFSCWVGDASARIEGQLSSGSPFPASSGLQCIASRLLDRVLSCRFGLLRIGHCDGGSLRLIPAHSSRRGVHFAGSAPAC